MAMFMGHGKATERGWSNMHYHGLCSSQQSGWWCWGVVFLLFGRMRSHPPVQQASCRESMRHIAERMPHASTEHSRSDACCWVVRQAVLLLLLTVSPALCCRAEAVASSAACCTGHTVCTMPVSSLCWSCKQPAPAAAREAVTRLGQQQRRQQGRQQQLRPPNRLGASI